MDNDFDKLYHADQQTGQIFITFAVFAILIACLGLFGLVTYAAEQRTKEIGIRKVLGARVISIVGLLSKDFTMLVGIAALIAFPAAWWPCTNGSKRLPIVRRSAGGSFLWPAPSPSPLSEIIKVPNPGHRSLQVTGSEGFFILPVLHEMCLRHACVFSFEDKPGAGIPILH